MNDGLCNERVLREYINNNIYTEYNKNIQNFLSFIFGVNLNKSLPFFIKKPESNIKPDLCITHNNITKNISVKKGSGNSVHQEKIDDFFPYIKKHFGNNVLTNLKKFHYGDDTIDDTGIIRYNANECSLRYADEISQLNMIFNNWIYLESILEKFLFVGNIGTTSVDIIYYGNINSGVWASKKEIKNYVKNNTFCKREKQIHFGPLTYQVWGRNEKRTAKHPERRYVMQIKWNTIKKDLEKIRSDN